MQGKQSMPYFLHQFWAVSNISLNRLLCFNHMGEGTPVDNTVKAIEKQKKNFREPTFFFFLQKNNSMAKSFIKHLHYAGFVASQFVLQLTDASSQRELNFGEEMTLF